MTIAIVFSGQGNQHPEMLPWLDGDALGGAMSSALGVEDWRAALKDAAWARINAHAQPLITITALAAWSALAARLEAASIEVGGVAGYSVGELAACAAAGVFGASEAIALAGRRAACMDEASRLQPGGLCGVTGLNSDELAALLRGSSVTVAIRNGEDTVVIGGALAELDAIEAAASARGARCTRLAVSVASHTPLMGTASLAFARALTPALSRTAGEGAQRAPSLPLFDSDGNRVWSGEQARAGLARQISSTVRWDEVMDQLAARAPACVLEIGGGQALARLWAQRHPAIPARSADEFRTLDGLLAWIARCVN